jgi:hypothetical protein
LDKVAYVAKRYPMPVQNPRVFGIDCHSLLGAGMHHPAEELGIPTMLLRHEVETKAIRFCGVTDDSAVALKCVGIKNERIRRDGA